MVSQINLTKHLRERCFQYFFNCSTKWKRKDNTTLILCSSSTLIPKPNKETIEKDNRVFFKEQKKISLIDIEIQISIKYLYSKYKNILRAFIAI